MDPKAKEIANAKEWVSGANRSVAYGVCVLVAGTIALILGHEHNLPTGAQVSIGAIFGLIGAGMITESNYFASRKQLQELEHNSIAPE